MLEHRLPVLGAALWASAPIMVCSVPTVSHMGWDDQHGALSGVELEHRGEQAPGTGYGTGYAGDACHEYVSLTSTGSRGPVGTRPCAFSHR